MLKIPKFHQTKTEEEEFEGGLPIDLDKEIDGAQLREKLSNEVWQALDEALSNKTELEEKIKRWQKLFRGQKEEKTYPYPGCSNISIPMMRWLTETVVVRVLDAVFSQQKVFAARAIDPAFVDIAPDIEDGFNWWVKNIAKLRKKLLSPLLQAFKLGTAGVLIDYVRRKRTIYKYATAEERRDKKIKKYKDKNGNYIVKVPLTSFEGPIWRGIPLEDIIISDPNSSLQDAFLSGYRTRMRPSKFENLVKTGYYNEVKEDQIKAIVGGDELDEIKEERAEEQHIEVDINNPKEVEVWKLYVRYDVDGDGEEDDIILSYHHGTRTILRAVYNPYFYGFRPLKELVPDPVEYSFYGSGFCEKLEALQEALDTLHNQRMDRANQLNSPIWQIREGSPIWEQNKTIRPGVKLPVEEINRDIAEVGYHDIYPDTIRLEALIQQYAQLVAGVSPHVMGQPTTERPVARETLALIQELNKKYKYYIDNIRDFLEEAGQITLEMMAQFQPEYKYKINGEERSIKFYEMGNLRDGIKIELMASSEVLNTEVKREIDLTLYQLLSDYSTKLAGMAQAAINPQIPLPMRKLIYNVARIGAKLMKRIVRDFGNIDAEDLVPDLEESIPEELAMRTPEMPPQPEMAEGEEFYGGTG